MNKNHNNGNGFEPDSMASSHVDNSPAYPVTESSVEMLGRISLLQSRSCVNKSRYALARSKATLKRVESYAAGSGELSGSDKSPTGKFLEQLETTDLGRICELANMSLIDLVTPPGISDAMTDSCIFCMHQCSVSP